MVPRRRLPAGRRLTELVDELGRLRKQIKELDARELGVREAILKSGFDKISGDVYDCTVDKAWHDLNGLKVPYLRVDVTEKPPRAGRQIERRRLGGSRE